MNETLAKIFKRLNGFKDEIEKANLHSSKIPDVRYADHVKNGKHMLNDAKHMNGKNVEQYNYDGEKVVHNRVPKKVADMNKEEGLGDSERADMTNSKDGAPTVPSGVKDKRQPVTHDECGRPFAKDDDIDAKIKARLKAEMDKRKFGEADAIRHKIDVDRGEKEAQKPKKEPLLQSEQEVVKIDDMGQWSIKKDEDWLRENMKRNKAKEQRQAQERVEREQSKANTVKRGGRLKNYDFATPSPTSNPHTTKQVDQPKAKEPVDRKGFKVIKADLIKALAAAGHNKSALLLKNWNELDKTAEMFKSKMEKEDLNGNAPGGSENDKNTRL